jgi:type IV pilus assembly protein PilW
MMSKVHTVRSSRSAQRGLSLVELMVSLTIGLFLLGAVGIIYVNTTTTSRSSTLESQMNEDAALALELLQQQIRLTGFSNADPAGNLLFPGVAVRGCDGDTASTTAGASFTDVDALFSALACNGGGTRSDSFAVRYEATLLNSQFVTVGGVQRPGNCAHEGIAPWAVPVAEGVPVRVPPTVMALADNRYYIDNDADGTPSLFCQGRTGAAFGVATALIPNIEDMQVQYAVTALPVSGNSIPHQVAGYVDADHEVLTRASVAPQPDPWTRVAAMRVCVIARSARPVPTGDNAVADIGRYVDCNGVAQTPNDRFVRRAYVTTIQLRNIRPGLPADFNNPGGGGAGVAAVYPWQYLYEN